MAKDGQYWLVNAKHKCWRMTFVNVDTEDQPKNSFQKVIMDRHTNKDDNTMMTTIVV